MLQEYCLSMITVMVENLCSCHGKFFSNSAFKSFAPRVVHGFYTPGRFCLVTVIAVRHRLMVIKGR